MKKKIHKIEIEEVQIGLISSGNNIYDDTGEVLEDGDYAFKIELPFETGDEPVYFTTKEAAEKYIKEELS